MYEVEIKIEVTAGDMKKLVSALSERGFSHQDTVLQKDVYVKAVESLHNAFDIERYRDEGGEYLYTKKAWEVENGESIRKEDEHPVSEEDFNGALARFPDALKVLKTRDYYHGFFENQKVTFSIDTIKFDHSESERYFIEPEIITSERAKVSEIKKLLRRFVSELLGIDEPQIVEAPGMFAMAYKKL